MSVRFSRTRLHRYRLVMRLMMCLVNLVVLFILAGGAAAHAQTKMCECKFDSADYQAYGTYGACGVFVYNKGHSCEVAFAGIGANPRVLGQILGPDAVKRQYASAPKIFEQYLAYEQGSRKENVLDPGFVENSIIVLERAALFRQSAIKLPLKEIDSLIDTFAREDSKHIAEVFAGNAPPYKKTIGDAVISVERGYVELRFRDLAIVRMVFFTAPR